MAFPQWLLAATYAQAVAAVDSGRITPDQWLQYRAIWRYSAPRFSNLVPDSECPRVRDAWRIIDAKHGRLDTITGIPTRFLRGSSNT